MRDLADEIAVRVGLNSATINGATNDGVIIDRQGYDSVTFVVQSGTITDGTWTLSIFEGDAANLSDGAAAPAASIVGAPNTFLLTDDNAVRKIGYVGGKRYTRLRLSATGQTTGGVFAAVAVLGHPAFMPAP